MTNSSSKLQQLLAARKAGANPNASKESSTIATVQSPEKSAPVASQAAQETTSSPPVASSLENSKTNFESKLENSDNQNARQIYMQLAELRQSLEANIPNFAIILREIHSKLRADPAVVTLMQPEEIRTVVEGLERYTQITVVSESAVKAAKKAVKSAVKVSAEDL